MNELNPVSLNREKKSIYICSHLKKIHIPSSIFLYHEKKNPAARSNFKSDIDDFVKYLYNVYQ